VEASVQKWGNSLAVRIPRAFAADLGLFEGSEVDIAVDGEGLRIRPVRKVKLALGDLLAGVTAKNKHGETDTGTPIGRESW
jgi:antitoxin MazE